MCSLLNSALHLKWLTACSLRLLTGFVYREEMTGEGGNAVIPFLLNRFLQGSESGQSFVYRWMHFSMSRLFSLLKYVFSYSFFNPHTVRYTVWCREEGKNGVKLAICLHCYQLAAGVLAFLILFCFLPLCISGINSHMDPGFSVRSPPA